MITHIQIRPFTLCNQIGSPLWLNLIPGQPIFATSVDYGFDCDEEELGRELHASIPANVADPSIPLISAEEFDSLYKWFIS